MRLNLFLFVLLFPFAVSGQQLYKLYPDGGRDTLSVPFSGSVYRISNDVVYGSDSLALGLIAHWTAMSENYVDSATYNSTGVTVSSVSDNVVTVSDGSVFVPGMDIRFVSPITGTSYTIIDTLGNNLTFDENVTASASDELYIACNGTLSDISGNNYTAGNEIGIQQPSYSWLGSDSVMFRFDGDNDGLSGEIQHEIEKGTISLWVNPDDFIPLEYPSLFQIGDGVASSLECGIYIHNGTIRARLNDIYEGYLNYSETANSSLGYLQIIIKWDGSIISWYKNGEFIDDIVQEGGGISTNGILKIGISNTTYNGRIDAIRVYNRALTSTNIKDLYNEEKVRFNID